MIEKRGLLRRTLSVGGHPRRPAVQNHIEEETGEVEKDSELRKGLDGPPCL